MHHATDRTEYAAKCATATCFADLAAIAIEELQKFPDGADMVCGPISSGGRGSVAENLRVFDAVIAGLVAEGVPLFAQTVYEEKMQELKRKAIAEGWEGEYYMPILEEFYLPLFEAGLIKRGWFIPGWNSSIGASWEREQLQALGREIIDLSEERIDQYLAQADLVEAMK
jgi:hypothetical protein